MELKNIDSLAWLFPRGTVLWRMCSRLGQDLYVPDFSFLSADHSLRSVIARVILDSATLFEPMVVPARDDLDDLVNTNKGILVFLDEEPPPDWTFLVVKNVSGRFRDSSVEARRGAMNAKVGIGVSMDDYITFIEGLDRHEYTKSFSSKIERAKLNMAGTNLTRCVITPVLDREDVAYQYVHFQDNPNDVQMKRWRREYDARQSTGQQIQRPWA